MSIIDRPEHGLAACLGSFRGLTMAQALERADSQVESLRERCNADLVEQVSRIGEYLGLIGDLPPPDVVRGELYRLASAIVALSGLYDRQGLAETATSLCMMFDAWESNGTWRSCAVDVHYKTLLAFLRHGGACSAEEQRVIHGLHRLYDVPAPLTDGLDHAN